MLGNRSRLGNRHHPHPFKSPKTTTLAASSITHPHSRRQTHECTLPLGHGPPKLTECMVICVCFWCVPGPFLKDAPCQNGVWTPPGVLSTPMLCDSFALLNKNGRKVDMWTSCSLLIIKRLSVHTSGGRLAGFRGEANNEQTAHYTTAKFGGALSWSTFVFARTYQHWTCTCEKPSLATARWRKAQARKETRMHFRANPSDWCFCLIKKYVVYVVYMDVESWRFVKALALISNATTRTGCDQVSQWLILPSEPQTMLLETSRLNFVRVPKYVVHRIWLKHIIKMSALVFSGTHREHRDQNLAAHTTSRAKRSGGPTNSSREVYKTRQCQCRGKRYPLDNLGYP